MIITHTCQRRDGFDERTGECLPQHPPPVVPTFPFSWLALTLSPINMYRFDPNRKDHRGITMKSKQCMHFRPETGMTSLYARRLRLMTSYGVGACCSSRNASHILFFLFYPPADGEK